MQTELTPKQQASELIKQAQNIIIITGREPNNDQLSAAVATQRALNKLQKQASVVITDELPKSAALYDTQFIGKDVQGVRDFIISLDMHSVVVDKLRYNVEGEKLDVTITPLNGNFSAQDVSFEQGPYKFDLVITLGVAQIVKLDKIVEQNPTIFDGLHLINIDYHRINEEYGSVNYVDQNASSVCEMLVSLFESLEQGMIDESIATALYAGITSATHNFTAPSTTAKSMTVAAQMLAAGARQQEVVKTLSAGSKPNGNNSNSPSVSKETPKAEATNNTDVPDASAPTTMKEAMAQAQNQPASEVAEEPKSDGSKKKSETGTKVISAPKNSARDRSRDESDLAL